MWQIDNFSCEPGEKKEVMFNLFGSGYEIPATMICGKEQGITMLITTQIHAGEYNGSVAAMELAKELQPEQVKGNILIMHCVNTSGFKIRNRRFVPEDGANLNSNYPGNPKGTAGARIAAWFVQEIFPKVDFIADLHGGKDNDLLEGCLFYPRAEKVSSAALAAAKCLNTKYLLASSNSCGEYGYAANYFDIPGMLIERGYGCTQNREWIEGHKETLKRLMKHLDIAYKEVAFPAFPKTVYTKSAYLEVDTSGVWHPAVTINEHVVKGQLLATVTDFFGNELKSYYAVGDGTIIYLITGLSILAGDEAIAYGLDEGSYRVE